MEIVVSRHADERIKERIGIKSEQRRKKLAVKAFHDGIRLEEGDRVTRLQIENQIKGTGRDYIVYQDHVFVFTGDVMVTVLPLDPKYRKIMETRRAKKRRNRIVYPVAA